ncbi:hypothetical protein B0H10DRAFT_582762 [Mycena sp. CBHHK59/15]|nr:hypothetical protein B0H10DRAFT_582762 [Mycena sp. CBHHK59/15]
MRRPEVGYIAGRGSREGVPIGWARWQCGRCLPGSRGQAPASGYISGEPRGAHAVGTLGVDRQGGMGTRGYDSLPAAREPQYTNLAHRPSSPPSASAQVSAPAAFHRGACSLTHNSHVSRPPAFSPPGSLYADRPSMESRPHFTHPLRVHHLHIFPPVPLRGGPFFCSPTSLAPPVPAYLWRASLRMVPCTMHYRFNPRIGHPIPLDKRKNGLIDKKTTICQGIVWSVTE